MKRGLVLFALVILTGIVAMADDPGQMPIDYKFVSPLPVGKMQYFPNDPGAPEAEIDLMCDGSFEDGLPCWEYWPTEGHNQWYNVGEDALHGTNVIIQGIDQDVLYQAMQCWNPGIFDGYMNFTLWSSYRVYTDEFAGWPPCSWSRGLFIEWRGDAWYRLTPDIWQLTRVDQHNHWTTIETHLPGMETLDNNYVCLLIESESCGIPDGTKFWFDEFVLAVDHEPDYDNVIFGPIVSKNYQ